MQIRLLAALTLLAFAAACGAVDDDPDGGKRACDPATPERCNFEDDDCDEEIDETFQSGPGVAGLGDPCDGADTDSCREGVLTCAADGTGLACSDVTGNTEEVCNGADEDCDGVNDNGFDLDQACDSELDTDLCNDDITVCSSSGGRVVCQDVGGNRVEVCNGLDDDCDGVADDGFNVGGPCDGPDSDACSEGTLSCNSAGDGTLCSDSTGNSVEICDGNDNDCDGNTDEGFLPAPGTPCDGPDTDSCVEGTYVCNSFGAATECNDNTSSTAEFCNRADDDCDGTIDEGYPVATSNGPRQVGAACDGDDTDLCEEGIVGCVDQTHAVCDDSISSSTELCNDVDDDCNGQTDEGGVCCGFETQNCEPEKGETCGNCPQDCEC